MLLLKTELGQQAFKASSALISARQRSAFILFDGLKTVEHVLEATKGLGVTRDDIDYLIEKDLLVPQEASAPSAALLPDDNFRDRYLVAKPLATQLVAGMGLRGFMLNLAVESASGVEELRALLPKIQDALGVKACRELESALNGRA